MLLTILANNVMIESETVVVSVGSGGGSGKKKKYRPVIEWVEPKKKRNDDDEVLRCLKVFANEIL